MKTKYKHIFFTQQGDKYLGKPFFVCERNGLEFCSLGKVGYSPHWEKYIFIARPNTSLDIATLKEIIKFLKRLN